MKTKCVFILACVTACFTFIPAGGVVTAIGKVESGPTRFVAGARARGTEFCLCSDRVIRAFSSLPGSCRMDTGVHGQRRRESEI